MKVTGDLKASAKESLKDLVIVARPLALENIAASTIETKGAISAPDSMPHRASRSIFGLIIMVFFLLSARNWVERIASPVTLHRSCSLPTAY